MEIIAYMTLKSKHIHTHTYAAALKIKRDSTLGHADQAIPLEFNIFFEKTNKQTMNILKMDLNLISFSSVLKHLNLKIVHVYIFVRCESFLP